MHFGFNIALMFLLVIIPLTGAFVAVVVLLVRALLKYLRSKPEAEKEAAIPHSLSETLKAHRVRLGMTQEFVAESLGVSRQAVSKWESGTSSPSTANLLAIAKLYGVSAAELLQEMEK